MKKEPFGCGRIHDTYLLRDKDGAPARILQRINTEAFRDPVLLMHNLQQVTDYIRQKGEATLQFLPFADGSLLKREDGGFWRQYRYLDADVYQHSDDPLLLQEAGRAYGRFAALLADFPKELPQSIPDFHNTPKYLEKCFAANPVSAARAQKAAPLLDLLKSRAKQICGDYRKIRMASPLRITHNDTKLNNVLFEKGTKKALCVIDLDTVMPGLLLYDFADGARSVSLKPVRGKAAEFSAENYRAFRAGYLEGAGALLCAEEAALTGTAFRLLCAELGTRYLSDYLQGDLYFKISEPESNYFRAESLLLFALEEIPGYYGIRYDSVL